MQCTVIPVHSQCSVGGYHTMLLFTDNMLHCTIPTAVFNCLKPTVVSKVANPKATGIILSGNHDR